MFAYKKDLHLFKGKIVHNVKWDAHGFVITFTDGSVIRHADTWLVNSSRAHLTPFMEIR